MARRALRRPRSQLFLVSIGAFLLLALVAEFLADAARSDVPPALAATACSTPNPTCPPGDTTKTSLHHIQHKYTSTDLWFEPDRRPMAGPKRMVHIGRTSRHSDWQAQMLDRARAERGYPPINPGTVSSSAQQTRRQKWRRDCSRC